MSRGLAGVRRSLYNVLDGAATLSEVPIHRLLPADVADVPAVVVGRPGIEYDGRVEVTSITVYVMGRTLADDDAQDELDELADTVLDALLGWNEDFEISTVTPGLVAVGQGSSFPDYEVTLTYRAPLC